MRNKHCLFLFYHLLGVAFLNTSCLHEQEIPVMIDFEYAIPQEGYTVPVQIALTNKTNGADFYSWTFEGASPSLSDKKQPGTITYSQAGTYTIRLEAWNDTQRNTKEITIQLDSAVTIDFDYDILVNDFVPASVEIKNKTRGASTYEWMFEGGTPATSTLAVPPQISFDSPGDHLISLKVTNGRETFFTSKTITLKPALQVDFNIIPSFEDEDYEAPLTATLENHTISGLRHLWNSTGGVIANSTNENTSIQFNAPGEYVVTLLVENDKETKSIERTITVKPNTNLYTIENVKLGISAAHATLGCFYSTKLREVFTKNEVSESNGNLIDIVFYSVNSGFSYCRYISPDSASKFTFPAIPNAAHTALINTLESSTVSFSVDEFDAMTDDAPLQNLSIKENDTKISFFSNSIVPRIILFEKHDGRKGAIKVKSFVSDGSQSYIIMDVKIQKE